MNYLPAADRPGQGPPCVDVDPTITDMIRNNCTNEADDNMSLDLNNFVAAVSGSALVYTSTPAEAVDSYGFFSCRYARPGTTVTVNITDPSGAPPICYQQTFTLVLKIP